MKSKILIIDDDRRLNDYLTKKLISDKYEVHSALNTKDSYQLLKDIIFDLVVLDINLNENSNGLDILETIRNQDQFLPVLIISSISNIDTQIFGFDIGCDGYLVKPFYYNELKSRIERLISKSKLYQPIKIKIEEKISYREIELDIKTRKCTVNGKSIQLQKQLFNLLLIFVKNPDQIMTFDILLNSLALDENCDNPLNALYVYILTFAVEKRKRGT